MMIFGLNLDMLLPPYEEYAGAERERCEKLRLKIEDVINKTFSGKELIEMQTYKENIFRYLDQCGMDIMDDDSKFESLIRKYYREQKQEKPKVRKLKM